MKSTFLAFVLLGMLMVAPAKAGPDWWTDEEERFVNDTATMTVANDYCNVNFNRNLLHDRRVTIAEIAGVTLSTVRLGVRSFENRIEKAHVTGEITDLCDRAEDLFEKFRIPYRLRRN